MQQGFSKMDLTAYKIEGMMQQNYRQSWYGNLSRESIQPWKISQRNNATRVFTDGPGSLKKRGYDATKLQAISIRRLLSRIALTLKSRSKEQRNKGFNRWIWQPKKTRVWCNKTIGNLDTGTSLENRFNPEKKAKGTMQQGFSKMDLTA